EPAAVPGNRVATLRMDSRCRRREKNTTLLGARRISSRSGSEREAIGGGVGTAVVHAGSCTPARKGVDRVPEAHGLLDLAGGLARLVTRRLRQAVGVALLQTQHRLGARDVVI